MFISTPTRPFYPPLTSLAAVPTLRWFGIPSLPNLLWYTLSTITIFILAAKFFGKKVATYSALLFMFNPTILDFSHTFMSENLTILLLLITLGISLASSMYPLSGVFVALLCQSKFPFLLILPLLPIINRRIFSLKYLLSFFATYSLFTILFPTAQSTSTFTQHELWSALSYGLITPPNEMGRSLAVIDLNQLTSTHFVSQLLAKFLHNLKSSLMYLTSLPSIFCITLPQKLREVFLGLFFSFAMFHALTIYNTRYLAIFSPLAIIGFSKFITTLRHHSVFAFAVSMSTLLTYPQLFTNAKVWYSALTLPNPIQISSQHLPENSILTSNVFAQLSWYAQKQTLLLPINPADLDKLPANYLLLYSQPPYATLDPQWQQLIDTPTDYPQFALTLIKHNQYDETTNSLGTKFSSTLYRINRLTNQSTTPTGNNLTAQ